MKYLAIFMMAMFSFNVFATEVLVWDKKPLEIRLEVNKERIIEFPDNISMAIPNKVLNRMRVDSSAGNAYFIPRAPFPKARIKVTLVSTGEVIWAYIFAEESSNEMPLPNVKVITNEEKIADDESRQKLFAKSGQVSKKQLTQYATHDFFAPPEFKKMDLPIQESPILRPLNLELMFTGRSAGLFDLQAVKQYRTQNYTLTAIVLTNRTNEVQPIIFSDLEVNGYLAASSQHINLMPRGTDGQSSVLYYITDKPLSENSSFL